MRRASSAAVAGVLIACSQHACTRDAPAPSDAAPAASSSSRVTDGDAALSRAEAAARQLATTLRTRLTDATNTGGPAKAIEVCASDAQVLARQIASETGVDLGRSSLRRRNEANAAPAWVAEWLARQGERKAEGVEGVRAAVPSDIGLVARVLLPIAVEPGCLGCHGDPAALRPEVKAVLEARYPKDRATGYAIGDLRGALWAELRVVRR